MSRNKREGWYWGRKGDKWCNMYEDWRVNTKHTRTRNKANSLKEWVKQLKGG